jgi:hypothetical protein
VRFLGWPIHAQTLLIGGFASDLYLGNTMFDMYMKCGLLDYGRNVFDEMTERAAHLVIFKHRWRWKLSCWRPPWVLLIGGRGLLYLSRLHMMLAFPTFLELLGCTQSCIAASWCMLVTLRKWRGMIGRQSGFNAELLTGPSKFCYPELMSATLHDGRHGVPTWPWLQIRFAWVRISGAFGSKDNRMSLSLERFWRST